MKQFYEGGAYRLCEAARDVCKQYGIWWHIMLPLGLPALSPSHLHLRRHLERLRQPLICLTKTELKTIQIGLRMFITQYSAGTTKSRGLCGGTDAVLMVISSPCRSICAGRGIHRHQG